MKTLKQIKKIIFTSLLLLVLVFPSVTNAQDTQDLLGFCSQRGLASFGFKKGSVYSLAPGIYEKFEAHYNRVDIKIRKTGGRARTQVNIYLNNVYQGHITFENGDYKRTETYSLNNAKGKMVKVEIVNQSVTNRFDYRLRLYHTQKRFIAKFTETLMPNQRKSNQYLSCTNKYKFTIKRKQGNAKLRFIAYYKRGGRSFYAVNINSDETTKIIKVTYPGKEPIYMYWKLLNTDKNNFAKVEVNAELGYFKNKKKQGNKGKKIKKVMHKMNN